MNPLRLLPIIFSMLVLGAHFYRAGHLLLASGALLSLGLLCIRRPQAVWLMQGLLVAGAVEWLATPQSGWLQIARPRGFPGCILP